MLTFGEWRAIVTEIVDLKTSGKFPWSQYSADVWKRCWEDGIAPDIATRRFLFSEQLSRSLFPGATSRLRRG